MRSAIHKPRRWALAALSLLTLGGAGGATGCATNPVTGKREIALISEQQEIAMGQQGAAEVVQTLGLVDDAALQRYVQQVGAALAAKSQRPNLPWSFRVVDDPTPNAFALPGGPIFITRGLLVLMENEAELAAVLGHEIGHITARHSVSQMSRAQLAQIGLGVGSVLSPTVGQLGNVLGGGLQLLFLKYGRDDERESDRLGFDYSLASGYDVREMDDVFAALGRLSEASGQSPVPSWAASHPDPGERVETAQKRAASLDRPTTGLRTNQDEFLTRIDGLVFGENPRNGFFRQGTFVQPDLKFTLTLPPQWKAQNTPQAVVAVSPQQDAALQLTLAQGASPEAAARQFLSQQGLQAGQAAAVTVNGVPAVASYFQAPTEQGAVQGLVAFFGHEGRTYQVLGYAPQQRFAQYDQVFRQVVGSFAPLTDPALLGVRPDRVQVVRLTAATTVADLARRYPSPASPELLAIINQAAGPSSTLPAGTRIKVVASGGASGTR